MTGKSRKQGFKIIVQDTQEIFNRFKNTGRDTIGETTLQYPIDKIAVWFASNGQEYELHATIEPGSKLQKEDPLRDPFGELPGKVNFAKLEIPFRQLTEKYKTKTAMNAVFILNEDGVEDFIVHFLKPDVPEGLIQFLEKMGGEIDKTSSPLEIEGGTTGGHGSLNLPSKKLTGFEDFKKELAKFVEITELVVNGIYKNLDKEVPEVNLYLRPPFHDPRLQQKAMLEGAMDIHKVDRAALKKEIMVTRPDVSFHDIGGQDKARREIEGLSFAIKNPELYKKWGGEPARGILLFGPPGTGKTLLAKALATETKAKFFHVQVNDTSSIWYGKSEGMMQAIFDIAKEETPCILFFDEIDGIAPPRDRSSEAVQRVMAVLLENLDGLESVSGIMVVGSTNRPNSVDEALKRPGRLDRWVEVPLPDKEGRKQVFLIHKNKSEKKAKRKTFKELDLEKILQKTDKMSGADIKEIIRRAVEEKVRQEGMLGEEPDLISTQDVLEQISSYERVRESVKKIGFDAPPPASSRV